MYSLLLVLTIVPIYAEHFYREDVPRFKTFEKPNHEVYLGDKVKLSCFALSKSDPSVEWYQGDQLVDVKASAGRLKESRKHMTMDVKKVQVSDQGLWKCKVRNSVGSITRNFTIEIIDFCDYFLNYGIPADGVPTECICMWNTQDDVKRVDVDYSIATEANCQKYKNRIARHQRRPLTNFPCFDPPCDKDGRSIREHPSISDVTAEHVHVEVSKDPVKLFDFLAANNFADISNLLPNLMPIDEMWQMEEMLKGWKQLNPAEKVLRARRIVLMHRNRVVDTSEDEEEEEEVPEVKVMESEERPRPEAPGYSNFFSNFSGPGTIVEKAVLTPQPESKPFFKDNEDTERSLASPAGRTVRLTCKAGGFPEPRVIWHKNGALVIQDSPRASGSEYKIRKWTLEMEDTTVADSGLYMCEVFNGLGSITRRFNVTVRNRMRSPPFIVPNILLNQTVNVNSTVKFQCKVMSDLVPHIMWVRIEKTNGKYYYYNETANENMFRYTEMDQVPHATIVHHKDESFLTIESVQVEDQAIYACITGNSLGTAMANATLFVTDFHGMEIPTGQLEPEISVWNIILVVIIIMLISLLLGLLVAYFTCISYVRKKQAMEDQAALLTKRKKIIVTHKKQQEGEEKDGWSDLPSTYHIQIVEQTSPSVKGRRPRLSSDMTLLDDYEVCTDIQWEVDRSRLKLMEVIGSGAFGEVWKASLQVEPERNNGAMEVPVAVKKVKSCATEKDLVALVGEMEMFKSIGDHENVLRLLGCCTGVGPLYVLLELCEHGNLRDFLRAHRPKEESNHRNHDNISEYLEPRKIYGGKDNVLIDNMTQHHLVQFAWQVANGMNYMAGKKIVHRDLAARNVLVTANYVMKISDFGLSRDVHYRNYYRKKGRERIPYKWMAIESLDENQLTTIQSDVWSFGILLWEIMTMGGTPYPTIAMEQLFDCLKNGYRMESPNNCPEEVYSLMTACWLEDREKRPTFAMICSYLDWMLNEQEAPNEEQEVNTQKSGSSDDVCGHETGTTSAEEDNGRRRRMRPLSAPVFLPSDPQHSICDDEEIVSGKKEDGELDDEDETLLPQAPVYATPARLVRQHTDPSSSTVIEREYAYSSPRMVASVVAPSIDSAIGSPAWHLYDPNYSVPFLGEGTVARQEPSYVNVAHLNHQTTHSAQRFLFPPNRTSRSSELAAESFSSANSLCGGKSNPGFMPSPSPSNQEKKEELSRRYSDESRSSSGRGGSSAVSSAEGLGGIPEMCKIGVDLPLHQYGKTMQKGKELRHEAIDNLLNTLSGSI